MDYGVIIDVFVFLFHWLARNLLFIQNGRTIAHFKAFFLYFHINFENRKLAFRKHPNFEDKSIVCSENYTNEQKCHSVISLFLELKLHEHGCYTLFI